MVTSNNFYTDNKDIEFHLKSHNKAEKIFSLLLDSDKELWGSETAEDYEKTNIDILETIGNVAATKIAVNAEKVNKEDMKLINGEVEIPPTMKENIEELKGLSAHNMSVSTDFGGMEVALLYELCGSELISRACPSTLLNIGWYAPIAKIIHKFGNEQIRNKWIPPIVEGKISGSMALTEPDVGSDLAGMRSYGEKQEDGSWKIYGSKQFISNGSGGLSLVLAQNKKGANGLRSLNLFVVPQHIDGKQNYLVSKIEEKPGLHGSATCALQFNGSTGYLLGNDGEGFRYMLDLMNEARLAVGYQGLGLMEAVYRLGKDYADQRYSWGKPISEHEMIKERLTDLECEIKGFRSLLYQCAFYIAMLEIGEKKLEKDDSLTETERHELEKQLDFYRKKSRDWTPLLKWWAGERSIYHARNCLHIHGGYGYTTEYKPEWWVRESLILAIYEGTSEIQALMSIKDTLKDIIRNPRKFAEGFVKLRLKQISTRDQTLKLYYKMKYTLQQSLLVLLLKLVKSNVSQTISESKPSDIVRLIKQIKADLAKFDNISPALLHAAKICEIKAIVAITRALIEDAKEDESRTVYAERFANRFFPKIQQLKAEIEWNDPIIKPIKDDEEGQMTASAT